ncbi:hypothetical protein [Streptomyces sp. CB02923]|uniref:hypothetical protein n=1 Tax=Streptomyces sp. CB02923 TaxID=1718985 RepID=UPI001F5B6E0F|nr:hypothetical protein [Streptomyces sp. CB02923]
MRQVLRVRPKGRAVLAAALVLGAATGCSSAGQEGGAASQPAPARSFDAADPATWTLPIEAYLPSEGQDRQAAKAKELLIADCMKDLGLDWSPAPDLPDMGPKTLTDWRYGIHDAALAKKRGYKPDAAEQAAYDKAMEAGALDEDAGNGGTAEAALRGSRTEINGKAVPKGGCAGRAASRLGSDGTEFSEAAQRIGNDAFVRSKQDPKVVAVFREWSSCMKDSGYSYKEPLDASDDPRFSAPDVSGLEISTALADLACRKRHAVARTWFDAESALQQQAIEKNAENLDRIKKSRDAMVKKASSLLAGTA